MAIFICAIPPHTTPPHMNFEIYYLCSTSDLTPACLCTEIFLMQMHFFLLNFDVRIWGFHNLLIKGLPVLWNPIITTTCTCLLTVSVLASAGLSACMISFTCLLIATVQHAVWPRTSYMWPLQQHANMVGTDVFTTGGATIHQTSLFRRQEL